MADHLTGSTVRVVLIVVTGATSVAAEGDSIAGAPVSVVATLPLGAGAAHDHEASPPAEEEEAAAGAGAEDAAPLPEP